ncbi:hypothetical protein [Oceanirhabdus sp. W0125-5]|uniref:hypothetical protein n=1 Tax=Oceanirhabdus sp. W0125-5 TaxID=2999116 RepID=UPI0022F2B7E4|nr:hypothetical protein [Oceanirhabdus sp. W0125-5]WBW95195.1 hypothetical protein OW730_16040 [Oceanirhabdus sp. W0125-5]
MKSSRRHMDGSILLEQMKVLMCKVWVVNKLERCDNCNNVTEECYYIECFGAWLIYCKECYDDLRNDKSEDQNCAES